jgi:hypothetical protein
MTTETSTNAYIAPLETLHQEKSTKFTSSVTIPYQNFGVNGSSDVRALRIHSTEDISVTVSDEDITTLIPTEKLSTSYILSAPNDYSGDDAYKTITVTAIHDNTRITYSDWRDNTVLDYTLNASETRVHKDHTDAAKAYSIESSKPVAVFSGWYCMTHVKCSNMIEQIPPTNQLDTVYIIPPNYNTTVTAYVVMSKEKTDVTLPDNTVKSVDPSSTYGFLRQPLHALVVKSAAPILMAYFTITYSNHYNPYWAVVPGINQYLPRYKIIIPKGWKKNYISIMIKASAVGGLRANCESIDPTTIRFQENVIVDDVEYSVIVAEVTEGELTLESIHDIPFGLMVEGHRYHGGYGFAGNVIRH